MSTETASWVVTLFLFLVYGTLSVSIVYFMYWLVIEMPVLVKIKHEELYESWRDR